MTKLFNKPADHFRLVIVRDMWLTGFDAPCLHTMYVDKPMRGHGLMLAIARVNRVFKDKPGGLIVDYLGIADQLKRALSEYTVGDRRETGIPIEQAVEILLEKHEIIVDMYHGFDYDAFFSGTPAQRLSVLPTAQEHILSLDDGKSRYLKAVTELSSAFALSMPHEAAVAIRDDVIFFQSVRAALVKTTGGSTGQSEDDFGAAIRQIVSKAVTSAGVIDIYTAAGLKTPDLSILSDEFLAEVRAMPQRNLVLELLRKLINDEIKGHFKKNVVKARSFADLLEKTIRAYHNRSIEAVKIIEELIELASAMREAYERGESLGMTDDELAFYDALEVNDSAVNVLGDDALKHIAKELVEMVRKNVTIDWTAKEGVRARLRTLVKRILRKYGYPPDKQEKAIQTVLEQPEQLCMDWAA
jgi:type I restriction enzyme R subunit